MASASTARTHFTSVSLSVCTRCIGAPVLYKARGKSGSVRIGISGGTVGITSNWKNGRGLVFGVWGFCSPGAKAHVLA